MLVTFSLALKSKIQRNILSDNLGVNNSYNILYNFRYHNYTGR